MDKVEFDEYRVINDEEKHAHLLKVNTYKYEANDSNFLDVCDEFPFYDCAWLLDDVLKLSERAEEYLYIMAFDSTGHPKGLYEAAHGKSDEVEVNFKEIFRFLVLVGGEKFIDIHNHPNGCPAPSDNDIESANTLKINASLLDIEFVESFIVASHCPYYTGLLRDENKIYK